MKHLVRSAVAAGLLLVGVAEASPFSSANITSASQWNAVAADIASDLSTALEKASRTETVDGRDSAGLSLRKTPIQLSVGKSVFEKAVLASLAGKLIEKGFVVTDVVVTGGQKLDLQAIPLSKTRNSSTQVVVITSLTSQGVVKVRSMNEFAIDSGLLGVFRASDQTQIKTLEVK